MTTQSFKGSRRALEQAIRRLLIAAGFEPCRVNTGWRRRNGQRGAGSFHAGFLIQPTKNREPTIRVRYKPAGIVSSDFEARQASLEAGKMTAPLIKAGLRAYGVLVHDPPWTKSEYVEIRVQYGEAEPDMSSIAAGRARLRENHHQWVELAAAAESVSAYRQYSDQMRHEAYLFRLLGGKS